MEESSLQGPWRAVPLSSLLIEAFSSPGTVLGRDLHSGFQGGMAAVECGAGM